MASELEIIHEGEVVPSGPSLEDLVSEWSSGASETIMGQLRQARAAYYARTQGLIQAFRKEVKISISTAYDFAKGWEKFGEAVEDGTLSVRLESGLITIYHLIECAYTPDPMKALDEVEENGYSTRAIKARKREKQQEQAEEEHGPAEKAKRIPCPACSECNRCGGTREIFEVEYIFEAEYE